jgi:hypothetical protein
MSKNNSNLNNKFGVCCGCPPLMSDRRLFTNYVSSRTFNDESRKAMKLGDSHAYRGKLQSDASIIASNEIAKANKQICKSDGKTNFYIDTSKYSFNVDLVDGYWGQKEINYGVKKSENAKF